MFCKEIIPVYSEIWRKKHILWAECRIFEMLTWWYIKLPVDFGGLKYTQKENDRKILTCF